MNLPTDRVLPLLEGVRRSGRGWLAICPAHDDRSPSLSLREGDDCRLLLRCWAGCDVQAIVGALGLDLADLFPQRDPAPGAGHARQRRPWSAGDLIDLAAFESSVAAIVAADLASGRDVSERDRARMVEAARRLGDIVEAVHVRA